MQDKHVVLIGYRATGKTTLAALLADRLGRRWVDADEVIEERAGKTIAEIFAEDGEPVFRDMEEQAIADLCEEKSLVLATGGGAPMRETTRERLRRAGIVVYLTAEPETILARMTGDTTTAERRPDLTDKSPLDEIVSLLEKRTPIYREVAHVTVETEGKTPEALTDEIMMLLETAGD